MAENKKAARRYKIIDACLRNTMRRYPKMEEIIEMIREKLDVDVSPETIQKDIAAMKEPYPDGFDAPIRYNRSKGGYEYTDPNYSINGVALNSDDVTAIKQALDIIDAIGGSRVSERFNHAVEKMITSIREDLPTEERERKIIQTDTTVSSRGFEHFDTFVKACRSRIPVNIIHYSYTKRAFKTTTVHPILLKEFDSRWYVIGHSEAHGALRTFGLDRIYSPVFLRKVFIEPSKTTADTYLKDVYGVYPLEGARKEQIVIRTRPLITNYFRAQKIHDSQQLEMESRGSALITFELIPSMELLRLFLSYGNELDILQPISLRERLTKFQTV